MENKIEEEKNIMRAILIMEMDGGYEKEEKQLGTFILHIHVMETDGEGNSREGCKASR